MNVFRRRSVHADVTARTDERGQGSPAWREVSGPRRSCRKEAQAFGAGLVTTRRIAGVTIEAWRRDARRLPPKLIATPPPRRASIERHHEPRRPGCRCGVVTQDG